MWQIGLPVREATTGSEHMAMVLASDICSLPLSPLTSHNPPPSMCVWLYHGIMVATPAAGAVTARKVAASISTCPQMGNIWMTCATAAVQTDTHSPILLIFSAGKTSRLLVLLQHSDRGTAGVLVEPPEPCTHWWVRSDLLKQTEQQVKWDGVREKQNAGRKAEYIGNKVRDE